MFKFFPNNSRMIVAQNSTTLFSRNSDQFDQFDSFPLSPFDTYFWKRILDSGDNSIANTLPKRESRRDKEEQSAPLFFLAEARGGKHSRPRNWDDVPEAPRESYSRWSAWRKNRKDRSAATRRGESAFTFLPVVPLSRTRSTTASPPPLSLSSSRFYSRSVLPAAKLPLLLRGESSPPTSLSCPPRDVSFFPRFSYRVISLSLAWRKKLFEGIALWVVHRAFTISSLRDFVRL